MVTSSPSASQPLHLKQTFLSDHPLSFLVGLVGINSLMFAEYAALSLECRRGTSKVRRALQHQKRLIACDYAARRMFRQLHAKRIQCHERTR